MEGALFLTLNLSGSLDVSNADPEITEDLFPFFGNFARVPGQSGVLPPDYLRLMQLCRVLSSLPTSHCHNESRLQPAAKLFTAVPDIYDCDRSPRSC